MKKIKLNFEELNVDSFITSMSKSKPGTIKGEEDHTTYTENPDQQCISGVYGGNCQSDFGITCDTDLECRTRTEPFCMTRPQDSCKITCDPILCEMNTSDKC